MQKYVKDKYGDQIDYKYEELASDPVVDFSKNMGDFTSKMIGYFKHAIDLYKASMQEKFNHSSEDPWVLFVVEAVERNVID